MASECSSQEKTWTPGVCKWSRGAQNYGVRVGGQELRRQLLHTQEQVETEGDLPLTREPQTLADHSGDAGQPVHPGEALTPMDAVGPTIYNQPTVFSIAATPTIRAESQTT